MHSNPEYFPYEYYSVRFSTFSDEGYSGYKKKLKSVLIDSANMNSEYATNDFVKRMYSHYTENVVSERAIHRSQYRQMREQFCSEAFSSLNERVPETQNYSFGLKSLSHTSFENDMMIYENSIGIDNKGTGRQIFIKAVFALEHAGENVDVILIEEPENHLSHVNLRKLVKRVSDTQDGQLFITTHNSLISTRLELKNLIILHNQNETSPVTLRDLSDDTAKYFITLFLLYFICRDKRYKDVFLSVVVHQYWMFFIIDDILINDVNCNQSSHDLKILPLRLGSYPQDHGITVRMSQRTIPYPSP